LQLRKKISSDQSRRDLENSIIHPEIFTGVLKKEDVILDGKSKNTRRGLGEEEEEEEQEAFL
jgi:hypothetical protein